MLRMKRNSFSRTGSHVAVALMMWGLLYGMPIRVYAEDDTIVSSGFEQLDAWTRRCKQDQPNALGYPGNYNSHLEGFYEWYTANGMENILINNAGDPFGNAGALSSIQFEREVVEYFAPLYGFEQNDLWGMVTMSGTDGNNHGIYFGVNYLRGLTGKMPIVYVSDEAHYSNYRLCDLQNLEVRLVKTDAMGQMIPDSLEAVLDVSRPCLMIYAMGSTFKGAIDDQQALNAVLARHPEMPVYKHIDAALFGGYLPFTDYRQLVDRRAIDYQSISISGHKFFGIDSPCGLFITTRDVYEHQVSYDIPYLNENMRMISCSRSGTEPLKFWWMIQTIGVDGWHEQASTMLSNTAYLMSELQRIGWPCWSNGYSNTVFFRRPSDELVKRFNLACSYDDRFGGKLAHVVVMQHVTREAIDRLIATLSGYDAN